ncbi:MAG: hypothetical protein EOM55_00305 [Clostridia bacterium]|nr:hypothetical protein [Clostridia bacterium]
MVKRFKLLVLMQLQNRKFLRSLNNKKLAVAYVCIKLLLMIISTGFFYFVLYFLKNFMALRIDQSLLLFVVGFMQIIGIISITFSLTNDLFFSKDNPILFSLPVKNNEILFSRLIVFYIKGFNQNLFFLLPLFFAFGSFFGLNILYFVNLMLLIIVLPLFPILFGAIFSVGYSFVKKLFAKFPYVKMIFIVAFVFFVWLFIASIMNMLPVPLRLLEIYHSFIVWVYGAMQTFNSFLLFYSNLINILFATRTIYDYLLIIGIIFMLVAMIYAISLPFYFKMVNVISDTSQPFKFKNSYSNNKNGVFKVFLLKEIRSMTRNTDKFTEYLVSIISFPFILYVLNTIFTAINTNRLGDTLVIGFNLIIGLMILMSANSVASNVISSEGEEFGLLKTVPNRTQNVIWAKILINIVLTFCAIVLGFVVLAVITQISIVHILLLSLVFLIVSIAHILWSIQLDLLSPFFAMYKEKGKSANNPNMAKSVLIGVLFSFLFGIIAIYFMNMNIVNGWLTLLAIATGFLALRAYLLTINIKVYYKRLEM